MLQPHPLARSVMCVALLLAATGCPKRTSCAQDQVERDGVCQSACNNSADCPRQGPCVDGFCKEPGVEGPDAGVAGSSSGVGASSSRSGPGSSAHSAGTSASAPLSSSAAGPSSSSSSLSALSSTSSPVSSGSSAASVSSAASSGTTASSSASSQGSSAQVPSSSALPSSSSNSTPIIISSPKPTEFLQYDGPVDLHVASTEVPPGCRLAVGAFSAPCAAGATDVTVSVPATALENAGTVAVQLSAGDGRVSNTLTLQVRPSGARRQWWIAPMQQGQGNPAIQASVHLFNPHRQSASVVLTWLTDTGNSTTPVTVDGQQAVRLDLAALSPPLNNILVATQVDSDVPITANGLVRRPGESMDVLEAIPTLLTTWYIPGRYDGSSFTRSLLFANPGFSPTLATIHELQGSNQLNPASPNVPPLSALQVSRPLGNGNPVAWKVTLGQPGLVTSVFTTSGDLVIHGGLGSLLSNGWLTGATEDLTPPDQVVVFNPGTVAAQVTLQVSRMGGVGQQQVINVPPNSVETAPLVALGNTLQSHRRVQFSSPVPVAMALEKRGNDNCGITPTAPARDLWFPGGTLVGTGTHHLVLHNVTTAPVDVTIHWMASGNGASPMDVLVLAGDETREWEAGTAHPELQGRNFGVTISASAPVLAFMDRDDGNAGGCYVPVIPAP